MKRRKVGIRQLKNETSRILDEVGERRSEYVVTKHGRPVAVIRPWDEDDSRAARLRAVTLVLEDVESLADRVARAAGRRGAEAAVSRQRR